MKNFEEKKNLAEKIEKAVEGLYYMSETDAEIFLFFGEKSESVTAENLLEQIKQPKNTPVEERDFDEFFEHLTKMQNWFGEEEAETAGKFANLRDLLKKNLKDLKVFKVGRINLDVYFVGLDAEGRLVGIKTQAVET
ncbi:MAG TPA: nuclease A inhibitor family protein [Pyrinomonadaceae bacterium]|nr:nuclease A inhibitor family protein [Pyrinomonadaceae bacterium]